MISIFNSSRIRAYTKLSTKKQNKVKIGLEERFQEQKRVLNSRIMSAKKNAIMAHRFIEENKNEKAKEKINSFKLELEASQPVLNSYVATSLEKQLMDIMSMDGFEFPDLLTKIKKDINFGLFSVDATEELGAILELEINPFDELGIKI